MFLVADSTVIGSYLTGIIGLVSAAAALYKVKPDAVRTTVSAAEGAVIVQTSVIANLNVENEKYRKRNEECEKLIRDLKKQHYDEVAQLEKEHEEEIVKLRKELKSVSDRHIHRREEDEKRK